jgi:class 3 adenylate cyclase
MSLKTDIEAKVREYLKGDYDIQDFKGIPSVEKIAFGNVAKRVQLCALYIDLRRSTDLLFVHQKQTAGKIHKAFLHSAAAIVLDDGGYIRGFKGDSLMALWPADYKEEVSACVRTAMKIKWMLGINLAEDFAEYEEIDFGIGVDWGTVLVVRAGLPRNANNNDLLFMGECINYAVRIGEQAKGPYNVEISNSTYDNLEDDVIFHTSADSAQVNMWNDGAITWKGARRMTKITTYHWTVS